ncbi:MAG: 50S ribosomal protein L15, partial [Anaerolineales bacterium]|nr:50S ribosomal protein L15 [Anaerolineales bacterium]
MKLHDLSPHRASRRLGKRVGRGIAAGQGKTAGRGTKGAGSRSGSGGKLYREGGNLPFVRKLPFKRGFRSINRVAYLEVNLDDIDERFNDGDVVDPTTLAENGFMKSPDDLPIVVLGRGEVGKAMTVKAHRFSG